MFWRVAEANFDNTWKNLITYAVHPQTLLTVNQRYCHILDHVMVDFIKPNLLGTKKEFQNRFINPIQNGQCSNSTPRDVRVMKLRCHVLFKLLSGCVQVSLPDLQQSCTQCSFPRFFPNFITYKFRRFLHWVTLPKRFYRVVPTILNVIIDS